MKKSVTIRKANPGETPGYYNKTASFLNKALPKAKMGMEMNNELPLQTIMLDTYSSIRDGGDPKEIFKKLLTRYGMQQEMAYKIMQVTMKKLISDGYADPSLLGEEEDEEETDTAVATETNTPAPQGQPQGQPQGPDESEELALSESEEDSGYDGMDHYNNRDTEQQEEQGAFSKYGGPFRRKLRRAQDGMQQPSEEEMMMMQQQQQQQPPQQGQEQGQGGDQMQQIMQQVGQALQQGAKPEEIIVQLLQGQIPPEAIVQIFVEFGMEQEQVVGLIQAVMSQSQGGQEQQMQQEPQMSQEEMMRYGGFYENGGEEDVENYYNYEDENPVEDTIINNYNNPGQLTEEQQAAPMSIEDMMRSFNLPSSNMTTPNLDVYLDGIYNYENIADDYAGENELLPMSQAKYGGALAKFVGGGSGGGGGKGKKRRAARRAAGTSTVPVEPIVPEIEQRPGVIEESYASPNQPLSLYNTLNNAYQTKNAVAPERGFVGSAAQLLGTGLNYIRPQNWTSERKFGMIGGSENVAPSTTATKTYQDIHKILMDPEYVPETLVPNGDGTFNSGLAFNMGPQLNEVLTSIPKNTEILNKLKNNGAFEFEFPSSTYPELNFMSLHNDKSNTKIRLTTGQDGALKAEIITDVLTKLKGLDKNKLTIKDEFFIDPKNSQIIDPRTGLPLDQIQKTYYKGNELNWYNQSGTFPFTNKFGKGLNLGEYPQVISADPLKQTPGTRRNAAWNMIGKPLFASPFVLPFTYPGFAAKNKFYPQSKKVTIDYFGRQRELGPQAPGGMTFADQPFGTQFADYTLQANRNYRTGRNFMIGAGLLGAGIGGSSLYYNRDTGDMEVDTEDLDYKVPTGQNPGFGFKLDVNSFGRKKPITGNSDNNYGVDSMLINNGDTINNKIFGELAPDYKYGGSHKKKFLKRMQQMFEPGGETQDPSLGKGSRMDNFNNDVLKKKSWVGALKKEADKVANEELYKLVQKSGDPKLMNIFMGDQQQGGQMQQPMSNRQMKEGGDPCPDGEYWDGTDCVPYAEGVPNREQLFNNPTNLDYLNKLNRKRNVQEYENYRKKQLNDYREQNYKGPMKQHDDGSGISYPDYDSPEWDKFIDSEESKKLRESLPDPEYQENFDFPQDYQQKDFYPKEGDWDEDSKKQYNKLFNPDPTENEEYRKVMEQFMQQHPEIQEQLDELLKQEDYNGYQQLKYEIEELIPFQKGTKNYNYKPGELQQDRYDDWCPCMKTKRILVQGQPVDQQICVPCDQAEEGGYVNMNTSNPLTRFVYGGDEYDNPDYYEPNDLIEARNGISVGVPGGSGGQYIPGEYGGYDGGYAGGYTPGKTKRDPIVGETYDTWYTSDGSTPGFVPDNRVWDGTTWSNGTGNQNTHNCDPGFKWVEEYQMCVPIMQTKYRPNIVPNNSGFLDNFIPWNRRRNKGYTTQQKSNPFYLEGRNPYTGQLSGPRIASLVTKRGIFGRPKESLDIYNVGTGGVELSQLLELAKQNQRGNRTNEKDKYRARIPKKVHEKNYFIRRLFAKDPGRDKHRASLFAKKAGRDGYRARIPKKLKD